MAVAMLSLALAALVRGASALLQLSASDWKLEPAATVKKNSTQSMHLCGSGAKLEKSLASSAYFWSNKNRDDTCTGAAPYSAPSELSGGPAWSWKDETASIVTAHPCIDGEKNIYLSHRNGVVRKFSPTGALLWENRDAFTGQASQTMVGGGVLHDGSIFVGTVGGFVLSIDMHSGHTNWNVRAAASAAPDSWSLVAHNGMVVTAGRPAGYKKPVPEFGGNPLVIALDAHSGTLLWTVKTANPIENFIGSFVDGPPSLIFSDWLGIPYRVALCDGRILWTNPNGREAAAPTTGGLIVDHSGSFVFVTGNMNTANKTQVGTITAYRSSTGAVLWQRTTDMMTTNAPAIGKLRTGDDRLSVVIGVFSTPPDVIMLPDPAAEKTGFFADGRPVAFKSRIFAVDAETGAETGWAYEPEVYRKPQCYGDHWPSHVCLPDAWSNAAIAGDGTVYVGHMSGRIFALQDKNGDGKLRPSDGEVSSFFGGRCYQGSPGLAPGMLVATPCDGLHVFGG